MSSAAAGGFGLCGRRLGHGTATARRHRLVLRSGAKRAELGAVAVDRALAVGQERLPGDAAGIGDPGLLRLGVAAGGEALVQHRALRAFEPALHVYELGLVLDLDAEMAEAGMIAAAGG